MPNFFFFNDTATTEIYTLSLHDALPIWRHLDHQQDGEAHDDRQRSDDGDGEEEPGPEVPARVSLRGDDRECDQDRKSTRLNSSHANISYAVFCLKKKKK